MIIELLACATALSCALVVAPMALANAMHRREFEAARDPIIIEKRALLERQRDLALKRIGHCVTANIEQAWQDEISRLDREILKLYDDAVLGGPKS